jgi:hypothetical protein
MIQKSVLSQCSVTGFVCQVEIIVTTTVWGLKFFSRIIFLTVVLDQTSSSLIYFLPENLNRIRDGE